MKKILHFPALVFLFCLMTSCLSTSDDRNPIVNSAELIALSNKAAALSARQDDKVQVEREVEFWKEKIAEEPDGYLYMKKLGELHAKLFDITGSVNHLHRSDHYLQEVLSRTSGKYTTSVHLALSANAIKKHQFAVALDHCRLAIEKSPGHYGAVLMSFDAEMELGNFPIAKYIIHHYADHQSFDYLVRYARWLDHSDNLKQAITAMERAVSLVDQKNKKNMIWALSNLADMYGHNGQIRESRDAYLDVLRMDPVNQHALKGLSWMAYAYDDDAVTAITALEQAIQIKQAPELSLTLAEMHHFLGNFNEKKLHQQQFIDIVKSQNTVEMYAGYMVEVYLDVGNTEAALRVAKKEYQNRPTPEMASLVAWAHFNNGDSEEAVALIEEAVLNKSSAPIVAFRCGTILNHTGSRQHAKKLLAAALGASYELGPLVRKEIIDLLHPIDFIAYR